MALVTETYKFDIGELSEESGGNSRSIGMTYAVKDAQRRGISVDELIECTITYENEDESSDLYISPGHNIERVTEWYRWKVFTISEICEFLDMGVRHYGHAYNKSMDRLQNQYGFTHDEAVTFCRQALHVADYRRSGSLLKMKLKTIDDYQGVALGAHRGIILMKKKSSIDDPLHPRNVLDSLLEAGVELDKAALWMICEYNLDYILRAHKHGLDPVQVEGQVMQMQSMIPNHSTPDLDTLLEWVITRAEVGDGVPLEWIAASV